MSIFLQYIFKKQRNMGVKLREKRCKNGKISLYLDIHFNGRREKKYLRMYCLPEKNQKNKEHNRNIKKRANELRNYEERELLNDKYVSPKELKSIDVVDYFHHKLDKYDGSDKRNMKGALQKFNMYINTLGHKTIYFDSFNCNLVSGYAKYLYDNCEGEGGKSYFKRFKKFIKIAESENLTNAENFKGIIVEAKQSKPKDILTPDEIYQLLKYNMDSVICRAFVFACQTGLGNKEIKSLTWGDIIHDGHGLFVRRAKNSNCGNVPLHTNALLLLGERKHGEIPVFDLPSDTTINKKLKKMAKSVGISKNLSFYCGRHSYGTNIYEETGDIYMVAELLQQSSLKYVNRYVKLSTNKKTAAINSLNSKYDYSKLIKLAS